MKGKTDTQRSCLLCTYICRVFCSPFGLFTQFIRTYFALNSNHHLPLDHLGHWGLVIQIGQKLQ